MAKKAQPRRGGAKPADLGEKVIKTAMQLAAEKGWRDLSLAEIAEASDAKLSDLYPLFSSKQAILEQFGRRIDAAVLADVDADAGGDGAAEPARDRLFDVLMRRFDSLQPYRAGLAEILYDQLRDPLSALAGSQQLRRSMACMLEAAGLSSSGLRGALRVRGLCAIYLLTLRVWLKDDTEDLAKTMAALDGYLRRIEGLIGRLPSRHAGAGR